MSSDPTQPPAPPADPAKARYLVLSAMRLMGVALVVLGLTIVNRKIDLPEIVGYAFILIGIADALVMPVVLARRWKSPLE